MQRVSQCVNRKNKILSGALEREIVGLLEQELESSHHYNLQSSLNLEPDFASGVTIQHCHVNSLVNS